MGGGEYIASVTNGPYDVLNADHPGKRKIHRETLGKFDFPKITFEYVTAMGNQNLWESFPPDGFPDAENSRLLLWKK